MPELVIPDPFLQLLELEGLSGTADSILREVSQWVLPGKPEFFPEYTDHGPQHLQSVLDTAAHLLNRSALDEMSGQDALVLVCAILLHDSALHLTTDGFERLTKGDWTPAAEPFYCEFDERSWPDLWSQFLSEAIRLPQSRLVRLVGDTPVDPRDLHRPLDKWDMPTRLLAGEFIRRHHARLAHEVAVFGVPGPELPQLELNRLPMETRDLIGLVARSHNLDLRQAIDLLPRHGRRVWRSVHVPLLMSLLRVADVLQVDNTRVSTFRLQLSALRSPESRRHWALHEAVKEVRYHEEDPECLFIDADPPNARTYLGLRETFRVIQLELDSCWAVLGEVYGQTKEREIGLRVRRVTHSLNERSLLEKLNYFPVDARFRAQDAIVPLLAGPLYGNNPTIGVRELLQNSLDAVRELHDVLSDGPSAEASRIHNGENDAPEISMLLDLTSDPPTFSIADRGIGMTPETVSSYFLSAGASFRSSWEWETLHIEDSGQSRVPRIGRFGVGALAAFLLGDKICVRSRHYAQEGGVAFEATIECEHIELRKDNSLASSGTQIEIPITRKETLDQLRHDPESWDWYALDHPTVLRRVRDSAGTRTLENRERIAPESSGDWLSLASNTDCGVFWRWSSGAPRGRFVEFSEIYNGMRVQNHPSVRRSRTIDRGLVGSILCPRISILDRSGEVTFDLSRRYFATETLPFDAYLAEAVARHYIACLIELSPNERDERRLPRIWVEDHSCILSTSATGIAPIGLGRGQHVTLLAAYADDLPSLWGLTDRPVSIMLFGANPRRRGLAVEQTLLEFFLGHVFNRGGHADLLSASTAAAVYVSKRQFPENGFDTTEWTPCPNDIAMRQLLPEPVDFEPRLPLQDLPAPAVALIADLPATIQPAPPVFAKAWAEIIGNREIPWNTERRQDELKDAYRALELEIARVASGVTQN